MWMQRLLLGAWMVSSGLVVVLGNWWVDHQFSPNTAIIQLWLSYSSTIFVAAVGNLWASRAWVQGKTVTNRLWISVLLVSLLAYCFFALRTLMPAMVHDIPFAELAADTLTQVKLLQAVVIVLIGKLCVQVRRQAPTPAVNA